MKKFISLVTVLVVSISTLSCRAGDDELPTIEDSNMNAFVVARNKKDTMQYSKGSDSTSVQNTLDEEIDPPKDKIKW
ncbi:MAG: hypothetical protein QM564_01455 [Bergeyella sp.]